MLAVTGGGAALPRRATRPVSTCDRRSHAETQLANRGTSAPVAIDRGHRAGAGQRPDQCRYREIRLDFTETMRAKLEWRRSRSRYHRFMGRQAFCLPDCVCAVNFH